MIQKKKLHDLKLSLRDLDYDEGIKISVDSTNEKIFINKNILDQYVVEFTGTESNEIKYYDNLNEVIDDVKKIYHNNFHFIEY
ncbi:MAG TPA: hypothetical protein VK250_11640 [Nitrososphaeraceae archaeon]|nr:hypothetical protein [Nitrososphaeraceae archaeon]